MVISTKRFVAGKIVTIGVVAALIIGAAHVARKYNLGTKITQDVFGLGSATGQAIISPFSGLVSGVTLGTEGLASQLGTSQEALFHQFAVIQDNFNKFIHPDWYNADGSYSTKNPNYGNGQSSIAGNTSNQGPAANQTPTQGGNAGLSSTSPNPNVIPAVNNKANIIPITDISKIFQQANVTRNVSRSGSGFVVQEVGGSQTISQKAGLTPLGAARTGTVGLGQAPANIQKLVDLSKKLGGPVFDTKGNLVALNGVRLAR